MHQTLRPGGGSVATAMSARTGHDPAAARAADSSETTWRPKQRHARGAAAINGVVTHGLFSAGLALQTALGLMDGHPAGQSIHDALAELDQAIIDLRDTVFGTRPTGSPRSGTPG